MTKTRNQNYNSYVVIIGGANMDICGSSFNSLNMNDSNPGIISMSAGGVARNIAENLALLKYDCYLLTAIGNDDFGNSLINKAKEVSIQTDRILKLDNEKTSAYLSIVDENGEMISAINDMSIVENITPEYIEHHDDIIKKSSVIVLDTNIPEETLSHVIKHFNDIPIVIDTVSSTKASKITNHLAGIHTLKCNKIEAETLTGLSNNLEKMTEFFHSKGVIRVFITLGEDGVYYSENKNKAKINHHKQHGEIINVTGAGDAFTAAIVYATMKKWDIVKSTHFGMAAAAITLNHSDTINPDLSVKEIKKIMKDENET